MAKDGLESVAGVRARLARPVRRVMSWVLAGANGGPADEPADATTGNWVVDCAVYVDGRRRPGRPDPLRALATARGCRGFVWLGLHEPSAADFAPVARAFGLDELVAGHALNADHRPAVERYDQVTVMVLRTSRYVDHPELTETSEVVETGAVTVFVGPRFVITVRHGAPGALSPVRADLEARPALLAAGPWAVAHAVCDRLVGSYAKVAAAVEADVDAVEEQVFSRHTHGQIAHIYQLKRELMEFKRAVAPLQRPLGELIEDRDVLPRPMSRYFRDLSGNLARIVERVTALDELLNSTLQARLTQVSIDQNNDMRKIAAWAAILAVQTFVAGVYGMNFSYIPGLDSRYGFPVAMLVMLLLGAVMYRGFRRNKWL
ncbi:magnesium and cobalt transport protein CorA [Micromonospora sp. NPDC049559]|uniref:magnesium and cobalt transport protein CorA n=1 Tax=Micromonospora sp. NPDC049559 TaxID=3155923 RepID=UPI003421EDFB